jgi:hypothetical protein
MLVLLITGTGLQKVLHSQYWVVLIIVAEPEPHHFGVAGAATRCSSELDVSNR